MRLVKVASIVGLAVVIMAVLVQRFNAMFHSTLEILALFALLRVL
jgi:hypothetical protein